MAAVVGSVTVAAVSLAVVAPQVASADTFNQYGGIYTDTSACVAGSYVVEHGITQVQITAVGAGGTAGETTTQNLAGGPADYAGGAGGLGTRIETVIPVHAGEVLYVGVANSGMPGGARSGDGSGGVGGAASWVTSANPVAGDGSCAPARSSVLVAAAGGGGGGGAGAKGASNPGGGGGVEANGGNGADGSTNKLEDGAGGSYPSATAPGSGGNPGHSQGCHGGQYGRPGVGMAGGQAADAGVDIYGGLGDCSEPPPTCGPCKSYIADAFGGGGGAGGGGYWGGGGGGGADDSGFGGGGGGASGRSYVANPVSETLTSTRTTPIVQINPVRVAPAITTASSVTFQRGVASSFSAHATGANSPYIRFIGALPAGLNSTTATNSDGSGTGDVTLSGTPSQAGVYPLTVDACNDVSCADQQFTLTVTGAPIFGGATSAIFVAGQSNSLAVTTSGYPNPTITDTGLPKGVTFTDHGDGTATIAGSPSATGANSFTDKLTATNSIGTAQETVTITVVTAVAITPAVVHLVPGSNNQSFFGTSRDYTQQLHATATYPDGSTGDVTNRLAWSSSDASVGTVYNGLVEAGGLGTITISAASASSTPSTSSVISAVPLSIAVSPSAPRMMGGTSQQFTATACYANPCSTNSVDISPNVIWSSPNSSMQVSASGFGTAEPNGIYGTVFATVEPALAVPEVQGESDIVITHGNVVSVELAPGHPVTLPTKGSVQYTPTLVYQDGSRLPADKPLTWSATDVTGTGVATALSSGAVIADSPGTATVHATYTNFDGSTVTGTASLTVIRTPSSLIVGPVTNPGNAGIVKGVSRQFQAIAHYGDGSPDVDVSSSVTWTSTIPSVASVSSSGLVHATGSIDNQNVTISASYPYLDTNGNPTSVSGSSTLSVALLPPVSIAITPASPTTLHPRDSLQFTATATYADGSTLDISSLVYWDSLQNAGTMSYPISDSGLLHVPAGLSAGRATVYAYVGSSSGTIQSNSVVVTATDPLDHVAVSSTNGDYTITAGTSTPDPYKVTGYDSQGNSLGDVTADSTLSISPDGSCAGDDTCTATLADTGGSMHTISATDPNAVHPTSPGLGLTVTRAAITHVSITGGSTTITAGGSTLPFHVVGTDNYGNTADLTNLTSFQLTPDGHCAAAACSATTAGAHTIVATVSTTSPRTVASLPLYVNPSPTIDHLVLSGGTANVLPGAPTAPYVVTAFDPYGNSGDITDQSTLSISPDGTCDQDAHTCTPATSGVHTVTAQNYAPSPLTSNALSLTGVGAPSISAAFTPASITQGTLTQLTWKLTNPNASVTLTKVGFTATVPASLVVNQFLNSCGGTFDDPTGSFVISGITLGAGASCTFTAVEQGTVAGSITSTTTPVTSKEGGPGNTATASLSVAGPPKVSVSFGTGSVSAGATVPLTFTVTNPNVTQSLSGIGFYLPLPAGLSYAGSTITGSCGGAALNIERGDLYFGPDGSDSSHGIGSGADGATLAAGQSCTFSADVTTSGQGSYTVTTSNITSNEEGTGLQGSATVAVTAPLDHFDIQTTSLVAGAPGSFTVTAEDSSGNVITGYDRPATISGTFADSASGCGSDGSSPCAATYSLSPFSNGVATATVTAYLGYEDGLITVTDGSVSSQPALGANVTAGPLDHIVLTGGSSSISAGGSTSSYEIHGYDAYGNSRGDDPDAALTMSPDGTCSTDSCTTNVADAPGEHHTVTATDSAAPHPTDTSTVTVGDGPIVELDVSGGSTSIVAGTSTSSYAVAAVDLYGNAIPVTPAGEVTLSMSPDGTCDQMTRTCTATSTGAHDVYFTAVGAHVDETVQVTPGPLDHLVLQVPQSSLAAGQGIGLLAKGADAYGNAISGDLTADTTFTSDLGTCDGDFCRLTQAGDGSITGTDGSATGSAAMHVDAGGLDHIALAGGDATVVAGTATHAYTVSGTDSYGNSLGDVTSQVTLSISPDGTCSAGVCVASTVGTHQVTAFDPSAGGGPTEVNLEVTAAPVASLTVRGGSATIDAGRWTVPYYVSGSDAFGNRIATVDTTLSISPDGHCDQVQDACTADTADSDGSFHTVTFTAADGATASEQLDVTAGSPQTLVISPDPATAPIDTDRAFTAEAFDAEGNDLGDVTGGTTFTVYGGGTCSANLCRSGSVGNHVVVGTDGSASGTATFTVTPGAVTSIKLTPTDSTATAGQASAPFQAEGYDSAGDDVGDVTSSVTLSISPDGTCSAKAPTCQSNTPDASGSSHTVTATYGDDGPTATANLVITPAPDNGYDHLVLTPSSGSTQAGAQLTYTATGYDSANNPVGDATADTTFTVSGGTCAANVCTLTTAGTQTVSAQDGSATGTASVVVLAGPLDHLQLTGGSLSATVGTATAPYEVEGFDAYGNDLGDLSGSATLSISPEGSCNQVTFTCVAATADSFSNHTVTATDLAAAYPTASLWLHVNSGGGPVGPPPAGAAPVVTGVSPSSGPTSGGTTVTISGQGFTGASGVSFGSTIVKKITVVSDTEITVTAPAGSAGPTEVSVTGPSGSSGPSKNDTFTYVAATAEPAAVSAVSPSSGPLAGGTHVVVTGVRFTGASQVWFGSVAAASFTVVSDTEIDAVSPAERSGSHNVLVVTAGGTSPSSSLDKFQFTNAAASTPPATPSTAIAAPVSLAVTTERRRTAAG
ncbi:IPT/TIG domain-containing protein [Jatrophihabitans sp.]|uniref:beta strand repeat-containing protein n=1 Tax=Jatrophihabitans sp. TaxID=1932789 RepID=UPI0030C73C85|nr:LigC protein [Jatrophihabitans sp.]